MAQLLVSGVVTGCIYALLGVGLTMVFSTTRMLNIAHGDLALIAALTAVSLVAHDVPVLLACVIAVGVAAIIGFAVYLLMLRPARARNASALTLLIASLALHLVLLNAAHMLWGSEGHALPPLFDRTFEVDGVRVRASDITVVVTLAVLLVVLRQVFVTTSFGLRLRAAAANPLGARVVGVRVERVTATAVVLSAVLAGIAGVLFAPTTVITYDMGLSLTLKGFVGATLARFTSYPTTVAACVALGVLESLTAGYLSSGFRDVIAFVALIAVLVALAIPAHRRGVLAASQEH